MENLNQKINEQIEKLKYLEGRREKNIHLIDQRVREIKQEKGKLQQGNHENK